MSWNIQSKTGRFLSSEVGSRNNFRDWELVDKLAFFEC